MYLLDTDHLTLLERKGTTAQTLLSRLSSLQSDELAVTIVTYEEQTRGWFQLLAKTKTQEDEILAYQRLEKHLALFSRLPIVSYTQQAAQTFQQLRRTYRRLGKMDLKIAAIAISQDATLLTRNLSDFSKIAELKAQDWSQ